MLRQLASIEMFAGAGGTALGAAKAGFRHLALNEIDPDSCQTLRANIEALSSSQVIEGDSRCVDWSEWEGKVDLLAAGAPCQPFSIAGDSRGHHDTKNLFPEVIRAVRKVRPSAVLLENVRGLGRKRFRRYLDYVLRQLANPDLEGGENEGWQDHDSRLRRAESDASYVVFGPVVMNAADYGVAQVRERMFVVAFQSSNASETWAWPEPTHSRDLLVWEQIHGVYWETRNLPLRPPPKASQSLIDRLDNAEPPTGTKPWRTVRDALSGLPDPRDELASDFYNHVHAPGGGTYNGHTGNIPDWPAKTVKAGCHGRPGGEGLVHEDNGGMRILTVRETARLQSFPDTWRFEGSRSSGLRQLGNAVPVGIAELLATHIADALSREPAVNATS